MRKMTKEKKEETAIKMWYGAAQFKGVSIGLETIWQGIIKKTEQARKKLKTKKMTEQELAKYKKFMLKKCYPNTEKSRPYRLLIEELTIEYNQRTIKIFDVLLKDIKESKQKAYEEHMKHWTNI